jgi:hypothetical protein
MDDHRVTRVNVDTRRLLATVFFVCIASEILLFLLDLTINWQRFSETGAIRRLFNTAREDSLASWFAIMQTFAVALVAWALVIASRASQASAFRRAGWMFVAILFTYLSVDDGAKVHERLGTWSESFDATSDVLNAYPSYAWQLVVGPVLGAMGLFMLFFLWRELDDWKHRAGVLAAFGFLALAVFLDFVEGLDDRYWWILQNYDVTEDLISHFSKSIEETLEMFAMTLFLVVFLSHLMRSYPTIALFFSEAR